MSEVDVYEIKLGHEFLMSSQFTAAQIELARLGLPALGRGDLDVVVGGLGLGYTAHAVLENPDVRSLIVVDALAEVIEWHEQGLLSLGRELTARSALPPRQWRLLRDVILRRRVGQLLKVAVDMHDDQRLDGEGVGAAEMARR